MQSTWDLPHKYLQEEARAYNIKYQSKIYQDYEEHKTENAIPAVE